MAETSSETSPVASEQVREGLRGARAQSETLDLACTAAEDLVSTFRHYLNIVLSRVLNRGIDPEKTGKLLEVARTGASADTRWANRIIRETGLPVVYYEMLGGVNVLEKFDGKRMEPVAERIRSHAHRAESNGAKPRLVVSGEGSSMALPAGMAGHMAQKYGLQGMEWVSANSSELGDVRPSDTLVLISNSGRTDSVIRLGEQARTCGANVVAITGDFESPLARLGGLNAGSSERLQCGREAATGATKSVVEQIMLVTSLVRLLAENEVPPLNTALLAKQFREVFTSALPAGIVRRMAAARRVVISGSGGIQKEMELKVAEILGSKTQRVDSCDLLHGPEEQMDSTDFCLIFDPSKQQAMKAEDKIVQSRKTSYSLPLVYVTTDGADMGMIPEDKILRVPVAGDMQPLLFLALGQNLLARSAVYAGKTGEAHFARKVGDGIKGAGC